MGSTTGMTTHHVPRAGLLAVPLAATLLLSACGDEAGTEPLGQGAITAGAAAITGAPTTGGDSPDAAPEPTTTPASSAASSSTSTDDDTGTTGTDGAQPAGMPPRPALDACVLVPVPGDGVYTVYEAGTAVITHTDGRLSLGNVQAAEGWTARVDDQSGEEVEIDFRRDGEVLDLQVEIEDGGVVEPNICADDD